MIIPYNNHVLVELLSAYKHVETTDNRTVETKSKGLCVAVGESLIGADMLKDKVVYFDEFEDTTNYTIESKKYALIDIKNIKGYEK